MNWALKTSKFSRDRKFTMHCSKHKVCQSDHLATENQKMVNKNNILVEADGLARHTWYMNFVCLEIYHKEDFHQVKWFEADSRTLSCPVLLQLSAKIIWKLWINASYTM